MQKKAYDIPNIFESLRASVEAGKITIDQAAEELCLTNHTPLIDVERTRKLLHL